MQPNSSTALAAKPVSFTLNGASVVCPPDKTILQAAQEHGVDIPRLCYMEGMRPDGNCSRECIREERACSLAAS